MLEAGEGLLLWLGLSSLPPPRMTLQPEMAQPEMPLYSARSSFPALLRKCWGSGTLTDHDARESQDEGGYKGRVGHHCTGYSVVVEHSSRFKPLCKYVEYFISVYDVALFVYRNATVGISVKGKAHIKMLFHYQL